ncbi:unnamed protein product [Protopolystoma xenopodis]|uniref:Uncharacterized protein n=1 Tax=Protopolystoma xenopodis TaxID=117903 RepID=A0A448X7I0_9PLAT|nr:unnamed protein product [Protopolystoma xenopodis]
MLASSSRAFINNYLLITSRNLFTSSILQRHQQHRIKKVTSSDGKMVAARQEAILEQRSLTHRKKWLEAREAEEALSSKLPPALGYLDGVLVYLANRYATEKLTLDKAIEFLRESADQAMFDCLDNPLYALVSEKFPNATLNICESHILVC